MSGCVSLRPLPDLIRFTPVLAGLNWHYAGLADGRIRPDIARRMFTAELIGPDGHIFHKELRAGVFLQETDAGRMALVRRYWLGQLSAKELTYRQ